MDQRPPQSRRTGLTRIERHPRATAETIEDRLKRVESLLARIVNAAPPPSGRSAVSRDRALHGPDMIPTGAVASTPYLDAEQAAAYLGITVDSLYGIVERRHLTPLRGPRRRYRFTKELLDEYLRRGTERR